MSAPAPDELAGGSARDPLRTPGWLRLAGLVALVGVCGWLVVRDGPPTSGAGPPGGRPTPVAEPGTPAALGLLPAQRAVLLGSQPGLLGVRSTCIRPGRDHAVTLGVDLVNGRLSRTTLLAATRVTDDGATRGGATLPARRTCAGRPATRASLVMEPGGVVPLRVRLREQDVCGTRAVSVQLDLAFLGPGEQPTTQRLALHPRELDVAICTSR
jgi:hypothetical protein